jgi:multiple sugar transport system substrate-binding protein
MIKKKVISIIVCLSLIITTLNGCGQSGVDESANSSTGGVEQNSNNMDSNESSEEKVQLTFYIWQDEEAYISDVVQQYNESQDRVEVQLTAIPNDEYDDKLKVLLAADSDVDIVDIRGMAQVTTYANSGALLDITEMIESSDIDTKLYGEMWNESHTNGQRYALPTRSTCWALFYNADMFDEVGIPYPEQLTWDEYGDLAVELMDKTGQYGGYWVPWIFPFASIQAGKYVDDEETSMLAESLQLLNRFYNVDQSHMSYAEIVATNPDYIGEFESERAAMLPNGEWCVQMLKEDEENGEIDFNWQIAPMPVSEGVEAGTTWGQFQFAGITSTTEYPEEAYDFLAYLCGEEGAVVYSNHGMIHAYSGEATKEAYTEYVGKDSASYFFEANKILEQPNTRGYDEVLTAFNEHAELYLIGEKTIEETIEAFEAQRKSILDKY